jgi:hypothetical protein
MLEGQIVFNESDIIDRTEGSQADDVGNKGAKDLTHNWNVGGQTCHVNVRE